MTILSFDFRIGGGSTVEVVTGTVDIVATSLRTEPSFVVLPEPTTIALHGGKATSPNLIPSPGGAAPEWAYKVSITDGASRRTRSFMVQVPDSGAPVPFASLPAVESVNPSMVNIGQIASDLEQAATASEETFVSAAIMSGELVLTRNNGQTVNLGKVEGDQGLPGPNAVPSDEAVATYLGTAGTGTQAAADARYMRTIMQPTAPPVSLGAMWVDSTTGKMHYPVDLGPSPRINKATNPSFESTTSMATAPVPAQFVAASQNLRYSSLDSGVAGQNWADRKAALAQAITDSGAAIVGCQENDNANTLTSQTQQLKALLGGTWAVADGSANNGILFKSDVFERLSAPTTLDVNRVNLQSGTQRTMTYAFFRHIATGRRIIFAVTHFTVDASSTANNPARTESAHIVGRLLSELRAKENDRPAIILTGDFNQSTSIADSPYAVLAGYGLTNVKASATTVENPTLNSYNGFDPAMAGRQNGECVDAVLTTSDLAIPSAGVFVKYAAGSALPLATPIPSDHNMVRANVSLVQLPAVRIQGTSASVTMGGSATAYQSTKWAEKGAVSACIDPAGAPTGSATAMYPAGQAGAMDRLGLEPGKTYTFAATYHLDAAQTGTLDGNARRIIIGVTNSSGSTSFSAAGSNTPPNAAGTTRCLVTYTVPAGSQNCFVRLMHGALNTPGYWDSLVVEEGSTSGAYFDGDTPGCYWEGTPHASRSIYPGPSWVPVGG